MDILGHIYRALTHRLVQVAVIYVGVGAALHRAAWYLGWTWDLPRWLDDAAIAALGVGFLPVILMAAFPGPRRAEPRLPAGDEAVDMRPLPTTGPGRRVMAAAPEKKPAQAA
ncbi:MAG TPA: hypothetical protein VEA79_11280 [Phenylobacterium sp.]|nr:hypothetical protein [Phenylobacterium sp.]